MKFTTTLLTATVIWFHAHLTYAGEVSPSFTDDINRLIEISGSTSIALQIGATVSNNIVDALAKKDPDLPQQAIEAIKDEINKLFAEEFPHLLPDLAAIYAKFFTHEEIKSLIAFYGTPVGKKAIKVMPAIINESTQVGQSWGRSIVPKLWPRLEARMKKEGFE